jgi:alpha-1,6-mannosyltransferase
MRPARLHATPDLSSGRSRRLWAPTGLGLVGSLLVAAGGPRAVGNRTFTWWYEPGWPSGRGGALVLVYAGMALLGVAWLWLGRLVATRDWAAPAGGRDVRAAPTVRDLLLIGTLWALPLALGPALYSHDVYSYLAQGTILHLGLNPYHDTPIVLAAHGQGHVLSAVSPFWRHTPAPYGPLFLGLVSLIVGVTGAKLIAGVLVLRGVELLGAALLAVSVRRLARALGTDPARAVWLALMSPLVLLELVAAGHNDILMAAILAAGVALALEGRPLLGIALCAVAATIKVPALAGGLFIAVAWLRAEPSWRARVRFALAGALIAGGVLAAVSAVTGLGFSWITSTVFSTPAKVRLAITPGTDVGYTVASLVHDLGVSVNYRSVESGFGAVAGALVVLAGTVLLVRTRISRLVPALGLFLVLAAAGGPAAWPWYFSWGLVLVAALPGPQRSWPLAVALAVSVFVVKPGGVVALPLPSAPAVLVAYALIAGALWYAHRRGGSDASGRGPSGRGSSGLGDAPARRPGGLADGAASPLART